MERQRFLAWLSMRGLSPVTVKKYTEIFNSFKATEFTQETVNEFLSDPNKNPYPSYRAFISNYKQFLIDTYPTETYYHKVFVPKRTGRKPRKLPDYPKENELSFIERELPEEMYKIMLYLGYYSALRPQGLINITPNNFEWDKWYEDESKAGLLKVTEKGNKQRIVFVKPELMDRIYSWISKHVKNPDKRLWTCGYDRWHDILRTASIKGLGRPISPHKLRHGGATWLLNNGWTLQEISEFIGHKSIATTQIYAHLDTSKMQAKYSNL